MTKKTPHKIKQELQDARAVELRHTYGYTYQRIADELGYATPTGARQAYMRGWKKIIIEKPVEARVADLSRLDTATQVLMAELLNGDLRVIPILVSVMERRSKFLGLDAPTKIESNVTTWEGGDNTDRAVKELTDLLGKNDSHSQSALDVGEGSSQA